jgi:hypothetical protein
MRAGFPFDFQWVSAAIVPMLAAGKVNAVRRRHLFDGASSVSN